MSSCIGYGLVIDESSVREPAYEEMRKKMMESDWDEKANYLEFLKDNDLEDGFPAFEYWIDNRYENDLYLWSGFEGFLVDYINHMEFNDEPVFRYEDYCIYVSATLPRDEEDRANIPTTKQICDIIEKYVKWCYVDPRDCGWETIHLD